MVDQDTAYNETLAWVNRKRAQFDLPALDTLPKGTQTGNSCPVAKALEGTDCTWVARTEYATGGASQFALYPDSASWLPLPRFVTDFIEYHARNVYKIKTYLP